LSAAFDGVDFQFNPSVSKRNELIVCPSEKEDIPNMPEEKIVPRMEVIAAMRRS
jgi:hypothetical protein